MLLCGEDSSLGIRNAETASVIGRFMGDVDLADASSGSQTTVFYSRTLGLNEY
jgi:hypothetical protein